MARRKLGIAIWLYSSSLVYRFNVPISDKEDFNREHRDIKQDKQVPIVKKNCRSFLYMFNTVFFRISGILFLDLRSSDY